MRILTGYGYVALSVLVLLSACVWNYLTPPSQPHVVDLVLYDPPTVDEILAAIDEVTAPQPTPVVIHFRTAAAPEGQPAEVLPGEAMPRPADEDWWIQDIEVL